MSDATGPYTLSNELQRVVAAATTSPRWDTTKDRFCTDLIAAKDARIAELERQLAEAREEKRK